MTYEFFEDSGHGWLKVSVQELKDMGILNKISYYSYIMKDFVYLEEDSDLSFFIDTKKKLYPNWILKMNEHITNGESGIRKFQRFYPTKELLN